MSTAIRGFAGQYLERHRMWQMSVTRCKSAKTSVSVERFIERRPYWMDKIKTRITSKAGQRSGSGCIGTRQSVSIPVDSPEEPKGGCCDCSCHDED